ncbi:uncharacterized protein [Leptinotarsa decemlineata]|uniref:uncharacterized protein n=1 Tax=Leptinotarsa decemlineata TaxID=7539 RepID=UPI003D30BF31
MSSIIDADKSVEGKVNILQDVVVQQSELPQDIVDFLTEFQLGPPLSPLPEEVVLVTADPRPGSSWMEDVPSTTPSSETKSTAKVAKKGSKIVGKRAAPSGSDEDFAAPEPVKKRRPSAKPKQVASSVKPKQTELQKYMKMWDESNPYRRPPMTSTLWRAPSTSDTTISTSKATKTRKQSPTAPQMLTAAGDIEPAITASSEATTEPSHQPPAGPIAPPPPTPSVQQITSAQPSGRHLELPSSQRTSSLVEDVLELDRICQERKVKLVTIQGSDAKLAEIASRKRRFEVRQAQLVEQKRRLLAEIAEVEISINGVDEEYRVEADSTNRYRMEVDEMAERVKALRERIRKKVDVVGT